MTDPRFSEHSMTTQSLPSSYENPRDMLSHATKYQQSASGRVGHDRLAPIKRRLAIKFGVGGGFRISRK